MNHNGNRYDDSPDSWPVRSSCGGGCSGGLSRMGVSQMPQRWDESWQPDYVPRAPATPRMTMPRFYPDEQPDAVTPVFSRAGVERLVPPRYDDSPDSPNFYVPRIPQMMQSPGMPMQKRPWDDGPDSPNFYGQPVPPVVQPSGMLRSWDDSPDAPTFYAPPIPQVMQSPGMPMQQRLWDDGPDTDNFYRPSSRNQLEMGRSVFQPWEEQPDAPNFSSQRMVETRQVPRFKPWDDGPDSDNFYEHRSLEVLPQFDTVRNHSIHPVIRNQTNYTHSRRALCGSLPNGVGTGNWVPIENLYDAPDYQIGAFYGRATGTAGSCNASMFGGRVMATNLHCRVRATRAGDLYVGENFEALLMGQFKDAEQYIQDRIEDLGIPFKYNYSYQSGFHKYGYQCKTLAPFAHWEQNRNKLRYTGPDIELWTCDGLKLQYSLPGILEQQEVNLLPGEIYGYIPYTMLPNYNRNAYVGFSAYALTIHERRVEDPTNKNTPDVEFCKVLPRTALLSAPGGFVSTSYSEQPKYPIYYFGVSNVTGGPGSSGSPFLFHPTNRAVGLVTSEAISTQELYAEAFPADFPTILNYGENNPSIQDKIEKVILNPLMGSDIRFTSYSGGRGGVSYDFSCPTGFVVGGVIGSGVSKNSVIGKAHSFDRLGNFGVICLPFTSQKNYSFTHARVFAGGSIDISRRELIPDVINKRTTPSQGVLFNEYINEYLSSGGDFPVNTIFSSFIPMAQEFRIKGYQQRFAMCPPGFYLSGLIASSKNFEGTDLIEKITTMICKQWKDKTIYIRSPRLPIGSESIPSFGSNVRIMSCPYDYFVDGIEINAGWYTDGFRLRCKKIQ